MTKRMQWLAAIALVVGGILLLCASSQAQAQLKTNAQAQLKTNAPAQLNPKAAAPTRFTVVDEG
ncbi:MAG: hypothetical protein WA618_11865, partial [Terriglobales bacterium]